MAMKASFRRTLARWLLSVGLGVLTAAGPVASVAYADRVDDAGKRLRKHQAELSRISAAVRPPTQVGPATTQASLSRKLIDGQVQFGMGNFDDASLLFFDVVDAGKHDASYDEALYYLAESLFQMGDNLGARGYFERLISESGGASKFYQQSLERLVELSLRLEDKKGIDDLLAALDRLPANTRRPSVPYVRGKYAHYTGDNDRAIQYFGQVPKNSKYSLQADYFIGASYIAKGDLGNAVRAFSTLSLREPRNDGDRRIIQLSYMALGRLYYERDQPSKAIDSYLNVDRKSDLFDDVLYEVAWVYVKNKEYPKALRALELLELTDPKSSRMPEVRILEGNLRIRKAQILYDKGTGNPAEEYDKALQVFTHTREAFAEPEAKLVALLDQHADPTQLIAQITGREAKAFETAPELPEVTTAWLREQPQVERIIAVETDLGSIESYIHDAENTIKRLELVVSTDARANIFPELGERRYRVLDIRDDTQKSRSMLLGLLRQRVDKSLTPAERDEAARLAAERERLRGDLQRLTGRSLTASSNRPGAAFIAVDQHASELQVVIQSTEAEITALEHYLATTKQLPPNVDDVRKSLADERREVEVMRTELESLRNDARLGRNASGATADRDLAIQTRNDLKAVVGREIALFGGAAARLRDHRKADQIARLVETAGAVDQQCGVVLDKINQVADAALGDVRATIAREKAKLSSYRREFASYDGESTGLDGEVIGAAMVAVSSKFRDVLMRSDVGLVDVAWSHKESNDRLRRRLVLDRARERKTLDSEFGDVIDELRAEDERAAARTAEQSESGAPVPAAANLASEDGAADGANAAGGEDGAADGANAAGGEDGASAAGGQDGDGR